jgi:hypothetical protein
MPRLLPNRVSRTLTDDNLQKIRDAVKVIIENLGVSTPITKAEYDALAKLGDKHKPFSDGLLDIIREHPGFLEEEQSPEEIAKDKRLYEQYDEVRSILAAATEKLDREQGIVGAEYRNAGSVYTENVKNKVNKGNKDAVMVMDKVNRLPVPGIKKNKSSARKPAAEKPVAAEN